ncbi:MAG: tetratricopeptide repeat protein [Deltaproteobacteria bacterium]|nr:tetratricopeptide repeat protein [Deltaproteobacteria bacterium]
MAEGGREIRRWRLIPLSLLAIGLCAPAANAVTLSELSEQVNRAAAGNLTEEQEQALFGSLADVSVEVANRYDAWVRSGAAEAKASAAGLADGLLPLLERLYEHHQGKIDRAQNQIIAQDGDPESLYGQKWWQLDRGFSLAAAGQLGWLHYRAAMLHPEAKEKRREWLKKSVKEFSEFVYAQDPKMSGESLLGRAMAERELGERDQAIGDLQAVLERGKDSPLYWPARLALAEVKSSGGSSDALAETHKLLGEAAAAGMPADMLNQIRLLRLEALAATAAHGSMSESARREAEALSRQLSQLGSVWSRRVFEIAMSHMKDPRLLLGSAASAEWVAAENLASADKFQEAIPAYQAVLRSTDPGAREHAVEAHHRLGVCYFRVGRYAEAEREFRTYLNAAPHASLAAEAAYLQFRSAEGMYRHKPSVESRGMFTAAVENYVKNYSKHENLYEGAFRLGEILQSERRFQEAADAYEKVKGPAAFEVRAAAAAVQSLADTLSNAPKDADRAWAEGQRNRAARNYDWFSRAAGSERAGATAELRARATLAKAMSESAGPSPRLAQSLDTLRDFEKRFPGATDLHLLAGALRLAAASGLGRYDEAAKGVAALPSTKQAPGFDDLLEKVAHNFLRTAADAAVDDPNMGQKWAALAAAVFDRLKTDGRPIPGDVKSNLAQVYTEQGRLDDAAALYRDLVSQAPKSKTVLRNAAMVADRRNAAAEAADYWARLSMQEEVATPAWYETRLAAARALMASNQPGKACQSVQEVDAFRPDLRDRPTKQKFLDLAVKACNKPQG